MNFKTFSKKQLILLSWWCKDSKYKSCDSIICDGAVRSGKTVCMSISYVFWATATFKNKNFAICGKTITSLKRNVITPLVIALKSLGFNVAESVSKNYIDISIGSLRNRFYLFGGKDESSAALIQGITLAGVMFDEVALMPRSFVEQALARCSVEKSKFWFNCNPEHPYHWFYVEWIKKANEKNCFYLHFLMEDNPSLSLKMLNRYKNLYSGRFYERFVLGKWVQAQGLVYPDFKKEKNVFTESDIEGEGKYYLSCDYGTVNPTSIGLWKEHNGKFYRLKEYYYDARKEESIKTDEEHYKSLEKLSRGYKIEMVVVDPSAASFIECINRHNEYNVIKADNDVLQGINKVTKLLKNDMLYFNESCVDTIREFNLYRWDENALGDKPVKQNDHAMDDIRYFVSTIADSKTNDTDFFAVSVSR